MLRSRPGVGPPIGLTWLSEASARLVARDYRVWRDLGGVAPVLRPAAPGPYRLPLEPGRHSARSGPSRPIQGLARPRPFPRPRPALYGRPAAGRSRCQAADGHTVRSGSLTDRAVAPLGHQIFSILPSWHPVGNVHIIYVGHHLADANIKDRVIHFAVRLALVAALAVVGYFGGGALLTSKTHAVETDEEKCERDKCKRYEDAEGNLIAAGCVDRFWPFGKSRQTNCSMNGNDCETKHCDEDDEDE